MEAASGNKNNQNNNIIYKFKPFSFEKGFPHPHIRDIGHCIVADSSNLYSFGVFGPSAVFPHLWKFNFALKKWTRFNESASSLQDFSVSNVTLLHGNNLMIYGHVGLVNQLYTINVNDEFNKIKKIETSGELPLTLSGQAFVHHNDYLYTIGGRTGRAIENHYNCDIHRLNLKSLIWEIVYICNNGIGNNKYEPPGRHLHQVGFDGKKIYILGGKGSDGTLYSLTECPTFDIDKNVWTQIETIPAKTFGFPNTRIGHRSAQIDSGNGVDVFITGGLNKSGSVCKDFWKLNLRTMQWTFYETCQLPRPTYGHAVTITPEGRLYVFRGMYRNLYYGNITVFRNEDVYSTWICIPKLSELCWKAVLQYIPQIIDEHSSADDLMNMGLPRHFVQRVEHNNSATDVKKVRKNTVSYNYKAIDQMPHVVAKVYDGQISVDKIKEMVILPITGVATPIHHISTIKSISLNVEYSDDDDYTELRIHFDHPVSTIPNLQFGEAMVTLLEKVTYYSTNVKGPDDLRAPSSILLTACSQIFELLHKFKKTRREAELKQQNKPSSSSSVNKRSRGPTRFEKKLQVTQSKAQSAQSTRWRRGRNVFIHKIEYL